MMRAAICKRALREMAWTAITSRSGWPGEEVTLHFDGEYCQRNFNSTVNLRIVTQFVSDWMKSSLLKLTVLKALYMYVSNPYFSWFFGLISVLVWHVSDSVRYLAGLGLGTCAPGSFHTNGVQLLQNITKIMSETCAGKLKSICPNLPSTFLSLYHLCLPNNMIIRLEFKYIQGYLQTFMLITRTEICFLD